MEAVKHAMDNISPEDMQMFKDEDRRHHNERLKQRVLQGLTVNENAPKVRATKRNRRIARMAGGR